METLRVLCLHGFRQDGDLFANKTSRLVDECRSIASLTFVSAPHLAAVADHGLTNNVVERSWCDADGRWDATFTMICDIDDSFDAVLGFSQGCSAALQLISRDHLPKCLENVRALILVASPFSEGHQAIPQLKSLHVIGNSDTITEPQESLRVAESFEHPEFHFHSGGHAVPQNKEGLAAFKRFFESIQVPIDSTQFRSTVEEEVSVVQAVFGDFVKVQLNGDTASIEVELSTTVEGFPDPPVVQINLGPRYPTAPAECFMLKPMAREAPWLHRVNRELKSLSENGAGTPMIFQLASAAATVLEQEQMRASSTQDEQSAVAWDVDPATIKPIIDAAYAAAEERRNAFAVTNFGKHAGGVMKFVIGLVGKPSAGKSTFFNAITDPQSEFESAKVGAFPFTTIEPNVGDAFFTHECFCKMANMESQCGAEFGHLPGTSLRRIPVVIKDVAGLVPGAYAGRGKGNQFLNDLCDAHVLVHVVDGSGTSTAGGEVDPDHASKPWEDIIWIRQEIHWWIFDNISSHWDVIRRKPIKLLSMFTGYHATPGFVEAVLESTGAKLSTLQDDVARWTAVTLHEFVASFVTHRFPTVLALNKADHPEADSHYQKVIQAFPHLPVIQMSAKTEANLLAMRRRGDVAYLTGTIPRWLRPANSSKDFQNSLDYVSAKGSTGVTEVLRAAVVCRPAVVFFPVDDFEALSFEGTCLKKMIMMKPGSNVEDAFRGVVPHGKAFVRAEFMAKDGEKRILKKGSVIPTESAIRFFYR
jgi:ribosome-binding ATPase YchF (GTP1/OBG family)